MDFNLIQTAITSIGFPIICCYFLYTYIGKKDQQIQDIMEKHEIEVDKLSATIERNTIVMEKLVDKLEVKE